MVIQLPTTERAWLLRQAWVCVLVANTFARSAARDPGRRVAVLEKAVDNYCAALALREEARALST